MMPDVPTLPPRNNDHLFFWCLALLGGSYVFLIIALFLGDVLFLLASLIKTPEYFESVLTPEVGFATMLSIVTCTIASLMSLWVAVPLGYILSRYQFRGKELLDTLLDIPIVLPPLVIGLSLLILFQTPPGRAIQKIIPVTYHVPSVILAQFAVSAAFAVRTMRVTFDQINPRAEMVAMTLGCSRSQAFWLVLMPESRRGLLTAGTLAWARSLGEFGPIMVFSGAIRFKTEVLSTTVFLELGNGNLEGALTVSLLMIVVAVAVLLVTRRLGLRGTGII